MAKCTICNARKGKRKCNASESFICSLCCGETRSKERCESCSFFKGASLRRNYRQVPYFTTEEMANSMALADLSDIIENGLSMVWANGEGHVNDLTVTRLVELQLDRLHFNDPPSEIDDTVLAAGHRQLSQKIENERGDTSDEVMAKIISAVYRSIQRRTIGGCSYLQFIRRFTGIGLD